MRLLTKTSLSGLIATLLLVSAAFYVFNNQLGDKTPAAAPPPSFSEISENDIITSPKPAGLIEQPLDSEEESFAVLATKLDLDDNIYQLAFNLANTSDQDKDFYFIPVSRPDQARFQGIRGSLAGGQASWNFDSGWSFDQAKHKQELLPALAQAYDDIDNNGYTGNPIKLTLTPKTTLTAQGEWTVENPKSKIQMSNQIQNPNDPTFVETTAGRQNSKQNALKPVYFLVYGSAGGVKDGLTILNVHSHPLEGENWTVSFETKGTADLTITPNDQATIDDDEFVSLSCDNEEITPQILAGDVIFYSNWECQGKGKVIHYTKKAGRHTLKFQFGSETDYAYNGTVTWDGSDSSAWATGANWDTGSAPLSTDDVIINGSYTNAPVISANVTVNSLAIGQTATSELSFTQNTAADLTVTNNITVYQYGTITVTYSSLTADGGNGAGRTITAANIDIQASGKISADGKGFAAQTGPGAGSSGQQGATHGGVGFPNTDSTYGSLTNPTSLGSGSYSTGGYGLGGGAIIISASGTVTVSGTLSANGTNGAGTTYGGGAGGSINITADTLAGSGTISANGGANSVGTNYGGGGGRISFNGVTTDSFSGTLQANGGGTILRGYAGTIYLNSAKRTSFILGGAGNLATLRLGTDDSNNYTFGTITIQNGGTLEIDGNTNLNDVGGTKQGTSATLNVTSIDVQSGGTLSANGLGFNGGSGPGGTGYGPGGSSGGATHGGVGFPNTDSTYGSLTNPTALGSGGGDKAEGGGAIIISASGTVTVSGTLSANGTNGAGTSGGGGAGGSINITANTLAGSGTISANGGTDSEGTRNGGGGGRISLNGVTTDSFTGTLQANGGATTLRGYAGTIYLNSAERSSWTIANGQTYRLGSDDSNSYTFGTITIQSGGTLEVDGNPNLNSPNGGATTINITSLDIQSGGTLSANGLGFNGGPGAGGTGYGPGGGTGSVGGTHGGMGYNNTDSTYGSLTNPASLGSGGGSSGGKGGGAIIISASGTVTVSGTLSANGTNGASSGGGGAGGSINITANTLAGSGAISANGGANSVGTNYGGGGGRAAIYFTTSYSITPTATGGADGYAQEGQDGTVFISRVSGGPKKFTGAATPSDPTSWYGQDGWLYRKKITIDNTNVDSDLTNFPLYVFIEGTGSGSSLASKIQDSGQDLRFTDSSGVRTLPHEIESYSEASGNVTAYVWVKVPTVSGSTDTTIYMYYGNSGASDGQDAANVWDANYKGVWHLEETVTDEGTAADAHIDSTSNANHGDQNGNDDATGKIYNSQDFDGTNDYVGLPASNIVIPSSTTEATIGSWIRPDTLASDDRVLSLAKGTNTTALGILVGRTSSGKIEGLARTSTDALITMTSSSTFTAGNWYYVQLTVVGTAGTLYVNGNIEATSSSVGISETLGEMHTTTAKIGASAYPLLFFNGLIDEVRISSTARSADWIKFEYNNVNEADNELSWGSEGTSSFTRTRGGIRAK